MLLSKKALLTFNVLRNKSLSNLFRHTGIRKHLREEESDIDHQFDAWHFVKNPKKSLRAAAKKSSCKIIVKWIKSIGNLLWCASATYDGDAELLHEGSG